MLPRRRIGVVLAAVVASLAAGCGGDDRRGERICPRVEVLEYADRLTEFAPGPGRDVTDVVLSGRVVNFAGECIVEEDAVKVELVVEFSLDRGPANRTGKARFSHFVAIEEFHPASAGKRVFPVEVAFEAGRTRGLFRDAMAVTIPLAGERRARDYNVFLGFQLERAQLDYNRSVDG